MKHTVKITVLDKKCYPELQQAYCADPCAGPCPCYNVGTSFCSAGTAAGTITGTWAWIPW